MSGVSEIANFKALTALKHVSVIILNIIQS